MFCSKNESEKPWHRANESNERNEKAKKAYEALMTVTLRKPTSKEYKNFSMAVKQRAKYKNITFTYGEEEVSILYIYHYSPLYTQFAYVETEMGIILFISTKHLYTCAPNAACLKVMVDSEHHFANKVVESHKVFRSL